MADLLVSRAVRIPDPLRIARYRRAPELGPRILFFSGGTALNTISRRLKTYTHNSIHLVTPFDSGGSSAKLRNAFDMPSIGDLRSRLMALADEAVTGHPEIYRLFRYRLPEDGSRADLAAQLDAIVGSNTPLVNDIPNPMRRLIRSQLEHFRDAMPADFDLRGASIGNLILAGGYMGNHQHLEPILFLFSKLVNVLGTVRAVVNSSLQLGAELEDGSQVIGQHLLTGKEALPLTSPIKGLFLSSRSDKRVPAEVVLRKKTHKLIAQADMICYPPGSFYSSLMANLLPRGVGSAIAGNDCPKVYIPNRGEDPEQIGMNARAAVDALLDCLRADKGRNTSSDKFLNFVLMDNRDKSPMADLPQKFLKDRGIQTIKTRLVSKESAPYYDPDLLVSTLLSLT
ncbi:MAG: GAK system CofD-like protein [Gammaproteobacteria bacterium]|nr:GAK system CofD-like protein [Gammaproteobacteria bacterium]